MTIPQYLTTINQRYHAGNATEHTFRGDLQQLLESLCPGVQATNEPKRQACGAPDYILTRNDIPVGYIEAKDIGDRDLDGQRKTGNKEQFDRYKASLPNLFFTDYLSFHLYREGEHITTLAIGELRNGVIVPLPENFDTFTHLVQDFCGFVGQTIRSSRRLAEMMAGKARLMADVIEKSLVSDDATNQDSTLREQMEAFKEILIHDITPRGFADVYAQTIAYGMFAARLHDPTLPTFSRQEAAELIPKSNPFLRKLFGYIAGPDIDDRIKWIVDGLSQIFLACNVRDILRNFGKATAMQDPIIHFYEDFLSQYDPALRKARGVWYTPEPVVNFIVRAVDDILKAEFGLPMGLADTSKTTIKVQLQKTDRRYKDNVALADEEVHRVQILDPATGTGTFLAEVVRQIHGKFKGQQGIWSQYVENHLLPRLNGFELLMASYAMAHLQLDLLLTDTGYRPTRDQRLRVYLTNSLEEHHPDTGTLFANWLSSEANEANRIKRDTPVMCVIGNPPYSVSSTNKGEWIEGLTADYKKDLNERNIQPLSDDYIKFIRYGQHFVEKNGTGILAFITNNSFLDGLIHRQMRKNLLETFDTIYILDLHGNAKKKETAPDGSVDQNVFDIQAGVSINLFIKTGLKKGRELGKVMHFDLYGKRESKYQFLEKNNTSSVLWNSLNPSEPNFYFVEKNFEGQAVYENGFKLNSLFAANSTGVKTHRDNLVIDFERNELLARIDEFYDLSISDNVISSKLAVKNTGSWNLTAARKATVKDSKKITKILYRPLDTRFCYYESTLIDRGREELMRNFLVGSNLGLIIPKQTQETLGALITNCISGHKSFTAYDISSILPLYLYPESTGQLTLGQMPERKPNLNREIVEQIAQGLGLRFTPEQEPAGNICQANAPGLRSEFRDSFAPIDLLDYIYAILHSPSYREKYKEFLKIDFPRVPYPTDAETFWQLVELGGQLRQIHLLESPVVEQYITGYPEDGSNLVEKPRFEGYIYTQKINDPFGDIHQDAYLGNVYINDTQYFEGVPAVAWEFYIGGYQPAQKWLKDRKGRTLSFDDILHYQKIIVALTETARLMEEIDVVGVE